MTKKLILIEFDYHPEVLRNTIEILKESCFSIYIFTTKDIWKKVGFTKNNLPSNIDVYSCKEHEVNRFIKRHSSIINSADCILYNTAASRFSTFLKADFKPTQVMRVHNANANFNKIIRSYRPIFTPFFIWKDTSHYLRKFIAERDHIQMKRFVKKMDAYAFSSDELKLYAQRTFKLNEKRCITLPLVFSTLNSAYNDQQKQNSEKIVLSVIGKIDPRNRNYSEIIEMFKITAEQAKTLKKNVELVFLGSANSKYGRDTIRKVQNLTNDYATITYFQNFVDEKVFQNEIDRTDFLIIPTHNKTRYTIYTEWYGKTKISGAVNDVIKYQKPAFINGHYPIDQSLKNVLVPYKNAKDLAQQIESLMLGKKPPIDFSQVKNQYSLSEVRKQYVSALLRLIEHH